jgi:hypothetical protein
MAKENKYLAVKIAGGLILLAGVGYGGYKGYKYFLNKNKDTNTGSKSEVTITLANGTTITTSSDKAMPATSDDKNNLMDAFQKWVFAGKFSAAAQNTVGKNVSRLSRYEIQNLTYLFNKSDMTQPVPYGLTIPEETLLIADLKKLQ